jgi:primosomal replication protein N''
MQSKNPLLQHLEQQLLMLASKASAIDQQAPSWQKRDWFDSSLFQCHSPMLLDYVQESMALLLRLDQTPTQAREPALAAVFASNRQSLAEKLSAQLNALTHAFSTFELRSNDKQSFRQYKKTKTQDSTPQRQAAGRLLAELGGTSQAMYQKLSEYHEFARRLQQMAHESAQRNESAAMQLAIHARLGRCRKAISALEAEIQWYEQRKSSSV